MPEKLNIILHGKGRDIPLVLAGPILRKVDYNSVTVWVALHSAAKVKLIIWQQQSNTLVEIPFANSPEAPTYQIGKNLHLACITVSGPNSILQEKKNYFYDLRFKIDGTWKSLDDKDICFCEANYANLFKKYLTYQPPSTNSIRALPGFVLPPDEPKELRIAHASCRLPHGVGADAMKFLDTEIAKYYNNPTLRPHLLCLTGDQIYADDVDTQLLNLIEGVSAALVNFDGNIEKVVDDSGNDAKAKGWLTPGARKNIIDLKKSGLTTEKSENHLVTLSDFYSMYLLVWSQVLWPITLSGDSYSSELKSFYDSLPKIRKILANIPTYMVADDHEITDDWFISELWCKNVLGKKIGRQIVRNGVIAHTLFQAWGNKGSTQDGLGHLENRNIIFRGSPPVANTFSNNLSLFGDFLYPSPHVVLKSFGNSTTSWKTLNTNWESFDFKVSFKNFQLIFLDTRTERGFTTEDDPVALIHPATISAQLGSDVTKSLTVIVSAAPVFGIGLAEMGKKTLSSEKTNTIKKYKDIDVDKYIADGEDWSPNEHACDELVKQLTKFQKVVLLSGDVHYGYTRKVECWDPGSNTNKTSVIVQCCASAIKNHKSWLLLIPLIDDGVKVKTVSSLSYRISTIVENPTRKVKVMNSMTLSEAAKLHAKLLLTVGSKETLDMVGSNIGSAVTKDINVEPPFAILGNHVGIVDFATSTSGNGSGTVIRHKLVVGESGTEIQYALHETSFDLPKF